MLAAATIDALGTGLFVPVSVVYFTRVIGLSATQVGFGLAVGGFVGLAVTPVAGVLLDRVDARRVVVACYLASAAAFVAFLGVDSPASFTLVALALQMARRVERPAMAVLAVGLSQGPDRTAALAWQQAFRNLGMGVGGVLAGATLASSSDVAFQVLVVGNAVSYLAAAGLLIYVPPVRSVVSDSPAGSYRQLLADRACIRLAGLNVAIALHDSTLLVAMPLWIATRTEAPVAATGLLFAANTALVAMGQVRTSRGVATDGGLARGYLTLAIVFPLACAAFALASVPGASLASLLCLIGLIGLTIGELHNTASEWHLSVELAPAHLRGRYFALFKTSMGTQQAIGPLLVTIALTSWGAAGWGILGVLVSAAALTSRRLAGPALERARRVLTPA